MSCESNIGQLGMLGMNQTAVLDPIEFNPDIEVDPGQSIKVAIKAVIGRAIHSSSMETTICMAVVGVLQILFVLAYSFGSALCITSHAGMAATSGLQLC